MRSQQQLSLPIGNFEPPEEMFRAAYQLSRLKISFEQAMEVYHFRICLKHLAMQAGKGRKK